MRGRLFLLHLCLCSLVSCISEPPSPSPDPVDHLAKWRPSKPAVTNAFDGEAEVSFTFLNSAGWTFGGYYPTTTTQAVILTSEVGIDTISTEKNEMSFNDTVYLMQSDIRLTGLKEGITYRVKGIVNGLEGEETSFKLSQDFGGWVKLKDHPFPGKYPGMTFGDSTALYVNDRNHVWRLDVAKGDWEEQGYWSGNLPIVLLDGRYYASDDNGIGYFDSKLGQAFFIENGPKGRGGKQPIFFWDGSYFYYGGGIYYPNDLWKFRRSSGKWMPCKALPFSVKYTTASCFVKGTGYLYNSDHSADTLWQYNAAEDEWSIGHIQDSVNVISFLGEYAALLHFKVMDGFHYGYRAFDPVQHTWTPLITAPNMLDYKLSEFASNGESLFIFAITDSRSAPCGDMWRFDLK